MADPKTVADVADKGLDLVSKFADQLTAFAKAQAPAAWEVAQQVARIECFSRIVGGFVFALTAYGVWCLSRFLWRKAMEDHCDEAAFVAIAVVGAAAFLASAGSAIFALGEVWNWVGLFEPQLFIAHTLLKL